MATDYDEIFDDYKKTDNHPLKNHCEAFTFLKVLGDVQAKSVLDLACGDGFHTRLIKQQGAGRVIGVDISKNMINRAREIEAAAPLGLEYQIRDVSKSWQIGHFDIVTAVYLFLYASTEQALTAMCHTIYDNLRPGGQFVSMTLSPNMSAEDSSIYEKYGVIITPEEAFRDGTTITFTIDTPGGGAFELSNFYWLQETYEKALQHAGFQEIIWHTIQVSATGIKEYGQDYWQAYSAKPYSIILECRK